VQKLILDVPLNRVEGDLEVRLELTDGVVSDAWSSGILFRGFERMMIGRGALDGLVVTPRICGICSTAHLTAACRALDAIAAAEVGENAKRIRSLALMTEHIQSDMRHAFLMFTADFANPRYGQHSLYEEAVRRYRPLEGETVRQVIRETKKVLEVIAILGGQWPHSAFMVPGGIASHPSTGDLQQCRYLVNGYRQWYERQVLGCPLERWQEVRSAAELEAWMNECDSHRNSELGFYIRFSREAGLSNIGKGHGNFLSFGSQDAPESSGGYRIRPGFAVGTQVTTFDQAKVAEHVSHSWYRDYEGGRHPFEGETKPYASGQEGQKYSWAKAPRYDGLPAETGPLAEMVVSSHPLITELLRDQGANVFVRELARLIRPALLLPVMEQWLQETLHDPHSFYSPPAPIEQGEGAGLTEAPRGALGHWVKVEEGKITHYQIIPPTAWNASPRDSAGVRGPWEEALIGTQIQDLENPVEVGHVVRSFDACLVCTVHTVVKGKTGRGIRL
jgi:hydrogenase large subunit